ncbi:Hypothetical predicted protein [Olea europaea subsp. europaea]|uniref:Uncharacterized protein n=1 Tax=Olea europaea subsp. europaea TaxID=158383 RepID=A0A8S0U7I3_OLEEU|nr:Hypothetical predicted protein [Olea europaea subsp. europaea]
MSLVYLSNTLAEYLKNPCTAVELSPSHTVNMSHSNRHKFLLVPSYTTMPDRHSAGDQQWITLSNRYEYSNLLPSTSTQFSSLPTNSSTSQLGHLARGPSYPMTGTSR